LKSKLRIGLLIDSRIIPAWSYRMLEKIIHGDYTDIVLVVENKTQLKKKSFWSRMRRDWKHQIYLLFRQIEDKCVKLNPDAFEDNNLNDLLSGIPILEVIPNRKKFSDYFTKKDLDQIRQHDLDILIRMGFKILRGKILNIPKYGIWSYHHGDNDFVRGGPAGIWEVIENHPVTGTILQVLTEDLDNGIVLHRSYAATDPLSINKNRNNMYWKNTTILPHKLNELYRFGESNFFRSVEKTNKDLCFYSNRLYKAPRNAEFFWFLIKLSCRWIRHEFRLIFLRKEWFLQFKIGQDFSTSFWKFKKLIPPKSLFWADPFVIYKEGAYYIYFEEFDRKREKGHISMMRMDSKGICSDVKPVIERSYHLSYPYIFEFEEAYYIVISNSDNETIEVFKCLSFPDKWEFYLTIMENINAVDASMFFHQNKWWMFTNKKEIEGASTWDSLFLFYSDNPLNKDWVAHPKNPIVSDVRKARSAGKVFVQDGVIYRPSQDCSKGYGYGIKLNQIDKLNEIEYQEHEITAVYPNWDKRLKGIHTINYDGGLTIIDGKRFRFRFFQ